MVVLSDEKWAGRGHFGDNRLCVDAFFSQRGDDFFRNRPLLGGMIKNRRPILCSDVVSLLVESGRVMNGKEYFENISERDDLWIKGDLYDLRMTRPSGAY